MTGSKWLVVTAMVLSATGCTMQLTAPEGDGVSADEASTRPTVQQLLGTWLARTGAERFVFGRTAGGDLRWHRFALPTCTENELGDRVCPPPVFRDSGAFSWDGRTLTLRDAGGGAVFSATASYAILRSQPGASMQPAGPNYTPALPAPVRQALVLVFDGDYMGRPTMSYRRSEGETFCQPAGDANLSQLCRDQVAQQPAAGGEWACTPRHDCAFVQEGSDGATRQRLLGAWTGGRTNPVGALNVTFRSAGSGTAHSVELRGEDCVDPMRCTPAAPTEGSYRAAGTTLVVQTAAGEEIYTFRIDGSGDRRRLTLFPVSENTTLPTVLRPSTAR